MDPKSFLHKAGIIPYKKLDQFFLKDEYLEKEADLARLKESDTVLEIGAGYGSLTQMLAGKANVIAVEPDTRFMPYLEKVDNTNLIIGDALKVLPGLDFNKVVANIPYSKSQKILLALLKKKWELAVLCVQSEFADKLFAEDKLGMLVRDCCSATKAIDVPAGAFYPEAVDSAVVVLKQHKTMDDAFWAFLRRIYRKRNTNAEKLVKGTRLKGRKINSLSYEEVRKLFAESKVK